MLVEETKAASPVTRRIRGKFNRHVNVKAAVTEVCILMMRLMWMLNDAERFGK
jgi:hypothetical protein